MKDILIIHRTNDKIFQLPDDEYILSSVAVFKTCLRQIAFVPWSLKDVLIPEIASNNDEVYQGKAAWQFLVEVLCGLHSPVFGETEVFGQFKKFIQEIPGHHYLNADLASKDFIYKTVKQVRTNYLNSVGGLSYGHVIRKKIKLQDSVSLWGFGQLGQEIYPWIKEKKLQVIVRNPFESQKFEVVSAPFRKKQSTHIIAAPLSDEEVLQLVSEPITELVIDLRGHTQIKHSKILSLLDVMTEIEILKSEHKLLLPNCIQYIDHQIQEFYSQAKHTPYGWDDLCC